MNIKKLTTQQEIIESRHVIDTAFLHPWDEEEAQRLAGEQATGTAAVPEERWGIYDDAGIMRASIMTMQKRYAFGGQAVPVGDIHMVGSLPEGRGGGNIRALMTEVLHSFKTCGDVFAILVPFSFSFYRKFGFELAARTTAQRVPINQLACMSCDYTVTRVSSEQDVATIRSLYDAFAITRNMLELRTHADWEYKGNGEWGERDFFHLDCPRYTYVLWDEAGTAHAYVTFIYVTGDRGPFVGELEVSDLVYDSPAALRGVLGFLYGMRAKVSHVHFDLMDDIDLATILPDCDTIERTLGGHVMARLLDVRRALLLMPHPAGEGSYTVAVQDSFMPENDGTYRVSFAQGHAVSVERTYEAADLTVPEETLCQLIVGRINLDDALYREGTRLVAQESLLHQVFVRRPVCLRA